TPVRSAAAGRVVQAGPFGGYGNYVCLAHAQVRGQQMTTCYAHLSQILVRKGQVIPVGDYLGRVGSTGASTGPHLHFEVRLGGRPTDPRQWL
ncbi:MAG: peptidoglycan DD-metalloendopeptidase family protein, partial [Micromonosporaceae bacterium]|nr:peptidoglycan DD-metalloendopeptidase family protein [Micromonosporaceae bacterium]